MNKKNNPKDPADQSRADNLKRFRLMLNLTQRQFLEEFLTNDSGELSMSVATYSNLESKGGTHLVSCIEKTCEQLGLDPEIFCLPPKEFGDAVEVAAATNKKLNRFIDGGKPMQGTIAQLVDRLTLYFADEVMAGRLKRGDQIETDRELAARMEVSRSSIREALKVLNVLGMIDIRMGQGMYLVGQESQVFSVPLSWSLFLDASQIDEILEMRPAIDQVDIKGKAILFQSGIYAKLPDDMPAGTALSALDVAGAPAQAARLVQSGQKVLVIGGGGKSGLLCLYEAKKRAGVTGLVVCAAGSQKSEDRARNLDLADVYFHMDATDAVGMYEKAMELTNGELFDVVINCVSIENTEMASILCTKDRGTVYFFSMATSFTKAALGAEGVGKDVTMIMGNGYAKGHAEITLQVLREHAGIRKLFEEMYA